MIWHVPQEICKKAAECANKETGSIPTEFDDQIVNGHALAAKKNGVNLDSWCMHTRPCKTQCTKWAIATVQWLRERGHI
jgi:hypothetical protein